MHSAGLELTKLTYTRLEDNVIRHRGDRFTYNGVTRTHIDKPHCSSLGKRVACVSVLLQRKSSTSSSTQREESDSGAHVELMHAQTNYWWLGDDAVYRTWNSAPCYYILRHMCLYLVVMDRVDQPMPVALGCCTIINWLVATVSVCVA